MNMKLIMKCESVKAHEKYVYFFGMHLSTSAVHQYSKRQELLISHSINCILMLLDVKFLCIFSVSVATLLC
jgi:hypothetical protein